MKKLLLAVAAVMFILPLQTRADEGMWLLQLLEKMNYKDMKAAGCKLTAKQIYDVNNSSLKDAIVIFGGGCTAEVVSDKGLVFTNHHCGYRYIQQLSGVGHDYLRDGYWAMNTSEELPAEGLSVTFIDRFVDVTDIYRPAVEKAGNMERGERDKFLRNIEDSLVKASIGDDKYLRGRVRGFYNNNVYYLIVTKTFSDVRFVGAPSSSIGKFGGETDNWEWPRHTGDFSVFRIYADKDNNPAPYSKDNVPYTPKKSLTISMKGYKPGDFTMIIGFPGSTQRYLTSQEVVEMRDAANYPRYTSRTVKEDIWRKAMRADEKINIQYANKFAGSSNFRKKSLGMNETFAKLNIVERRAENEKAFQEWVNVSPERQEKYGKVIETINRIVSERTNVRKNFTYLTETLIQAPEFIQAFSVVGNGKLGIKKNADKKEAMLAEIKESLDAFFKDYNAGVDRETSKALIKFYREKADKEYLPDFYETIDTAFNGSVDAYVDNIFNSFRFSNTEEALKMIADTTYNPYDEPIFNYWRSWSSLYNKLYSQVNKDVKELNAAKKLYMEGIMEKNGGAAMYPDANSTMRLTYGKVGGYRPKDGVEYKYYTTIDGVMEKEDPNNPEFVVPAKLKELWKAKDYGRYANENGELVTCFLTNNDITGGNSGSDVLNAKGELIGLAFDGNWESMSSDIIFETNLQRCINVDIRYVLFVIDKVGGAGYLLDELKIK